MKKKWIAWLLALAMLFSLVPTVLAADVQPAQDGLVFWLDGQLNVGSAFNAKAASWKDLKGGNDVSLALGENCAWDADGKGLTLKADTSVTLPSSVTNAVKSGNYTVEISVSDFSTTKSTENTPLIRDTATPDYFSIYVGSDNKLKSKWSAELQNNAAQLLATQHTIAITCSSGNTNTYYVDGVKAATNGYDQYQNVTALQLAGYFTNATYHGVRVYNRALTAAEVAANHTYDTKDHTPDAPVTPSGEPVQADLAFWLDGQLNAGRKFDDKADVWTDLANGRNVSLTLDTNCAWDAVGKGLALKADTYVALPDVVTNAIKGGKFTTEIVVSGFSFKNPSSKVNTPLLRANNDKFSDYIRSDDALCSKGSTLVKTGAATLLGTTTQHTITHTFDGTKNVFYVDGVYATESTYSDYAGSDVLRLAGNETNATYHGVRVYTRALSADEVKANYAYDQSTHTPPAARPTLSAANTNLTSGDNAELTLNLGTEEFSGEKEITFTLQPRSNVHTNGLQLWLDGRNNTGSGHNDAATTWTDLSGKGGDVNTSGLSWNEDGLHLTAGQMLRLPDAAAEAIKTTRFTVELSIKDFSASEKRDTPLLRADNDRFSCYVNSAGNLAQKSSIVIANDAASVLNGGKTLTMTSDGDTLNFYLDGVLAKTAKYEPLTKSATWDHSAVNWMRLGGTDGVTNVTYQGLRIYDRVLSEEEIRANVRADALASGSVTFEGSKTTVQQTLTFTNGEATVSLPLYGTGLCTVQASWDEQSCESNVIAVVDAKTVVDEAAALLEKNPSAAVKASALTNAEEAAKAIMAILSDTEFVAYGGQITAALKDDGTWTMTLKLGTESKDVTGITLYAENFTTDTYLPKTAFNAPPAVVYSSGADALNVANAEKRPSNVIVTLDETLAVYAQSGKMLADTLDAYLAATVAKSLPVLYIKDEATKTALANWLGKNHYHDLTVLVDAEDSSLLNGLADTYEYVRGAVRFGKEDVATEARQIEAVKTANGAHAKIMVLSSDAVTLDTVHYLQMRLMAVWAETASDTVSIHRMLSIAPDGIICDDPAAVITVLERDYKDGLVVNRTLCNTGHRGKAAYHVIDDTVAENTMSAFYSAYLSGALSIEIDVYLTTDNQVVICHNSDATNDVTGTKIYNGVPFQLEQNTLAEAQTLTINEEARKKGKMYDWDTHMPSLEELFQFVNGQTEIPGAPKEQIPYVIDIEVKSSKPEIVQALKALTEKYGMEDRVVISSFNGIIHQTMQREWPSMSCGIIHNNNGAGNSIQWIAKTVWRNNLSSHISNYGNWDDAYKSMVRQGQMRGITFWGWCVHSRGGSDDFIRQGFNGYTEDSPDWTNSYAYRFEQDDVTCDANGKAEISPKLKLLKDLYHEDSYEQNPEVELFAITEGGLVEKTAGEDGTYDLTGVENAILRHTIKFVTGGSYYVYSNPFRVTVAHTHTWSEEWSSDATNHWHACSGCDEKKDVAAHTPGSAATENDPQVCTVCGYIVAPATGHIHHTTTLVSAVEATCVSKGHRAYYTCSRCSKLFANENATEELTEADVTPKTDPTNHVGGTEVRNAKDATYTEEGYTGDTCCKSCHAVISYGHVIPKLTKPSKPSGGTVKPVSPNAGINKKPEAEEKGLPFTDVPQTAWYHESVQKAWENGLIDGVTKTQFQRDGTLTVAQAIKLAAALYQMEHEGEVTLTNGRTNWYDSYVSYAVANGIIEKDYASYTAAQMNAAITRAEFVHIFHGAESTYKAINQVADDAIPDVKSRDAFASDIYEFYRAGILTGSDAKGTFHPASSIKRSEVSAILVRMFDTASRQSITL